MLRCLELAALGKGMVEPNPMVGAVIVYNDTIIGEGFHKQFGGAHAEVIAIDALKDKSLLSKSTLYVNLEPCAHQGKTPPCVDLILENKIPRVVIGCQDAYAEVNGKGIEKLKNSGVEVILGVLQKESENLNKRFFTFHSKKRPYIILKWAQTSDGFIGAKKHPIGKPLRISNEFSVKLSHKWRTEEQAILIGSRTLLTDNPRLNNRFYEGRTPIRMVIDQNLRTIYEPLHFFDQSQKSIVFNAIRNHKDGDLELIKINFETNPLHQILDALYQRGIVSLIVEGGAVTHRHLIDSGLWDEARVIVAPQFVGDGIKAAHLEGKVPISQEDLEGDRILCYLNV